MQTPSARTSSREKPSALGLLSAAAAASRASCRACAQKHYSVVCMARGRVSGKERLRKVHAMLKGPVH
eukprot:1161726-Pelagomonas_calceolata.AAC.12